MTLFKFVSDITLEPTDNLGERVRRLLSSPNSGDVARKLNSIRTIEEGFEFLNRTSTSPRLHVLVQLPDQSKWRNVNSTSIPLISFISYSFPFKLISPNVVSIFIIHVR